MGNNKDRGKASPPPPPPLTAAEILRQRQRQRQRRSTDGSSRRNRLAADEDGNDADTPTAPTTAATATNAVVSGEDLDEQIARLEAELEDNRGGSSSDGSSSSSNDDDSSRSSDDGSDEGDVDYKYASQRSKRVKFEAAATVTKTKPRRSKRSSKDRRLIRSTASSRDDVSASNEATAAGGGDQVKGILCLSAVKDDRIEALPASLLPAVPNPKKKKSRTEAADDNIEAGGGGRASTKRQRHKSSSDSTASSRLSGLEAAVRESLRNSYVPRSSERLPFYCRVCAIQFDNLTDFQAHQVTELHVTASRVERELSYCKLCRKQLTSPAQLHEHLSSRPHKERLERLRRNHQKPTKHPHQRHNKSTSSS